MRPAPTLLLLFAMGSAAACGGATGTESGASTPSGTNGAAPSTSASASTATATPTAATSATTAPTASASGTAATGAPPVPVVMKAPVATALVADLQAIGIDAHSVPPIDKLEPKALRSVMKLLARSLGVKCQDCHVDGDFAAPTRRKRIAAKMWDEMAAKVTLADGSPVFCDSCHQGRITLLDRTDKKALGKWMDESFVDLLKRKDGKTEECESCHVDMDMRFLSKWGAGPAK